VLHVRLLLCFRSFDWLSGLLGDRGVNTEESRMARTEKRGPPMACVRAEEL
jgi:hypothetical protein